VASEPRPYFLTAAQGEVVVITTHPNVPTLAIQGVCSRAKEQLRIPAFNTRGYVIGYFLHIEPQVVEAMKPNSPVKPTVVAVLPVKDFPVMDLPTIIPTPFMAGS